MRVAEPGQPHGDLADPPDGVGVGQGPPPGLADDLLEGLGREPAGDRLQGRLGAHEPVEHPEDEALGRWVRGDLRWYVLDERGRFVKNGYENDVDMVIAECRRALAARAPAAAMSEPA